MTYYNIVGIILIVCLDLIILHLVWRALKGVPKQLSELSAAVVSFVLIAVGVVMTCLTLSTAVEAAKLTHAIPGKHMLTSKTLPISTNPRYRVKSSQSRHGIYNRCSYKICPTDSRQSLRRKR